MNKLNKKIFNRVLIGLFMMFVLSGSVYAINLEYKNSLSKVELSRISDDSYTINLYTSKKITDPVKVIKKNDLNYYILLPETKNSTGVLSSASSDIPLPAPLPPHPACRRDSSRSLPHQNVPLRTLPVRWR